eukprot:TRINITY_DN49978_c0_g1_i6.p1 TRINITY_DN49978_c0_g1~~TRINITY_DN49978_c0_g1_i6.p1  ORF type:complete len:465 (+),score=80.43 TRINITY_DN49978_c0_g1_i6:70-1395(+)
MADQAPAAPCQSNPAGASDVEEKSLLERQDPLLCHVAAAGSSCSSEVASGQAERSRGPLAYALLGHAFWDSDSVPPEPARGSSCCRVWLRPICVAALLVTALVSAALFARSGRKSDADIFAEELQQARLAAAKLNASGIVGFAELPILPNDKPEDKISCVIDASMASTFLGSAGLSIRAATHTCTGKPGDGAECSASVSGVLLSVSWVAAYISLAVAQCGDTLNFKAVCASDAACIMASLSEATSGASTIQSACVEAMASTGSLNAPKRTTTAAPGAAPAPPPKSSKISFGTFSNFKRLPARIPAFKLTPALRIPAAPTLRPTRSPAEVAAEQEERQASIASCSIHAVQLVNLLGIIGVNIHGAKLGCNLKDVNQKSCTISVLNLLASFSWVGTFIALLANECPEAFDVRAACTVGATQLTAGILNTVACSTAISSDCKGL